MMQKSQKIILISCFLMCILSCVVTIWLVNVKEKKIAVVDAIRLFDSYDMKKELEEIAKHQLQAESKKIDSLENALKMAKAIHADTGELKKIFLGYNYLKAKLEDDYAKSNRDINEKVWKRLNPLLQEYGKKKQLHLIIGANGMGSVLYNDDYFELTNDVIKYVNSRYADGN